MPRKPGAPTKATRERRAAAVEECSTSKYAADRPCTVMINYLDGGDSGDIKCKSYHHAGDVLILATLTGEMCFNWQTIRYFKVTDH